MVLSVTCRARKANPEALLTIDVSSSLEQVISAFWSKETIPILIKILLLVESTSVTFLITHKLCTVSNVISQPMDLGIEVWAAPAVNTPSYNIKHRQGAHTHWKLFPVVCNIELWSSFAWLNIQC